MDPAAAFEAARAAGDAEGMAVAALLLPGRQQFGVHPGRIPAMLHEAYAVATSPRTRCRLAAALARSWVYGGDAARAGRFAAEARALAAEVGEPDLVADALEAALVAAWGPDDFAERLSLAAQLDDAAAHIDDPELRLAAHLWRLTTAWECLDIVSVQRQLRALDVLATDSGSARIEFFATSRRAMYALVTGDLDAAAKLIDRAKLIGATIDEPDAEGVLHELTGWHAITVGDVETVRAEAEAFDGFGTTEGIPAVLAVGAVMWLHAGELERAALRARQIVAGGVDTVARDVDFLLVLACVAEVAAETGLDDVSADTAAALEPYAGRAVINGGAVIFHGVVDDYVFRARRAVQDPDAVRWQRAADNAYRRIGASWWATRLGLARPSAVGRRAIPFRPDAGQWVVGSMRLPDLKGLHYIQQLLARPGIDVPASRLAGAAVADGGGGDVLDAQALAAYRRRLGELDRDLDEASSWQDPARVEQLEEERAALLDELRAATGLGGRSRRTPGADERARVAVRKAIAAAIEHVDRRDPALGRLLRDTIRTGSLCRYEPRPDDPVTWEMRA